MTTTQWALGLVANPYPTVSLIALNDAGQVAWREVRAWTGKWDGDGEPVYRGTRRVVDTYHPHTTGGTFPAASVSVVDPTPRTWDEALRIASRCTAGSHVGPPIDDAQARGLIAAAQTAAGARVLAERYTRNWSDGGFLALASDEELEAAMGRPTEPEVYTAMVALRERYATARA